METYSSGINKVKYLSHMPPIGGRYVVFDTETTGLNPTNDNVIEIAAVEIQNGKLTGNQFHCFLKPRYEISLSAELKHKMSQHFYTDYYSDVYLSDKKCLENFLKFVNKSLIFAHNAVFDMNFINNELLYWNLPIIPINRFRCTMKLFKKIVAPNSIKQSFALDHCCNYFNLSSLKENFHSAIFDSFMTARMLCCLMRYEPPKREANSSYSHRLDPIEYHYENLSNFKFEDINNDLMADSGDLNNINGNSSPSKSNSDSSGHTKELSDKEVKEEFDEPITLDSYEMEQIILSEVI